jgi:hypothetical protein
VLFPFQFVVINSIFVKIMLNSSGCIMLKWKVNLPGRNRGVRGPA